MFRTLLRKHEPSFLIGSENKIKTRGQEGVLFSLVGCQILQQDHLFVTWDM